MWHHWPSFCSRQSFTLSFVYPFFPFFQKSNKVVQLSLSHSVQQIKSGGRHVGDKKTANRHPPWNSESLFCKEGNKPSTATKSEGNECGSRLHRVLRLGKQQRGPRQIYPVLATPKSGSGGGATSPYPHPLRPDRQRKGTESLCESFCPSPRIRGLLPLTTMTDDWCPPTGIPSAYPSAGDGCSLAPVAEIASTRSVLTNCAALKIPFSGEL